MTKQNEVNGNTDTEKHNISIDNRANVNISAQSPKGWDRPRIIELVGPPGSGKTTLTEILKTKNEDVRVEIFPFINNRKDLPFFALNLVRLSPDILRFLITSKAKQLPTKRDIAIMTILTGWDVILKKMISSNNQMIILEEGAVCLLAKLYGFGSEIFRSQVTANWWHKMYKKWAHTLDMVIILDTPIDTLLKRIRSRDLQYEIKDMPNEKAHQYLSQIQNAETHLITNLQIEDGPAVFHVSTLDKNPDQIAAEINTILRSGPLDSRFNLDGKIR